MSLKHLTTLTLLTLSSACAFAAPIEVRNNHDFPIHMPYTLQDGSTLLLDLPPKSHQSLDPAISPKTEGVLTLTPTATGVSPSYLAKSLGELTWSLVLHTVPPADAKNDDLSAGRPAQFKPQPLKLSFAKSPSKSPLYDTLLAQTSAAGLTIAVELHTYPAGFLDIITTVTNQSAPTKNVYAALLTHWTQPDGTTRTVDYNSTVTNLTDSTPWRKPGDRHFFVARGVNWLTSNTPAASVLWLNAFSPSFTLHHETRGKSEPQWRGANSPQLDQEAYLQGNTLTQVTELAHGNVKSYRARLDDYVLPDPAQPLTITQRLLFSDKPIANNDAANTFVAYTTYNSEHAPLLPSPGTPGEGQGGGSAKSVLELGAPSVIFGTAYFPYSTLGENFATQKLPGMSQDSYWPLAADVVKNYKLFADQIKTDLRIAKSMGFESIRLHHLEMLWTNPADTVKRSSGGSVFSTDPALQISPDQRNAFLDFFFAEIKHLGLKVLLDVKLPAADVADLVKRYHEQLNGVELDNEILIFGIPDADVQLWKDTYAAVKSIDPNLPVHLTAQTNVASFKRLDLLGVSYDRIGQHTYTDGTDAIKISRDFALQVASYATKINKPNVITEWNWRFLTRLTEEARAKVYAPIFESVIQAHAIPEIQQFQFNDSLAMSPLALKGIRHYELINLSRRPKLEAAEFQRIIDTYASPDSTTRAVKLDRQVVTLQDGKATATFHVTNTTDKPMHLAFTYEGPPELQGSLPENPSLTLPPGQTGAASVSLQLPKDAAPGFYHAFLRFTDDAGHPARYAWIEAQNPGQPTFDKTTHPNITTSAGAFDLDLTKPTAIVYGDDCPIPELEAAWVVYQTLESATGHRTFIFTAKELPTDGSIINTIYVGTPKSLKVPATEKQSITRLPNSNTVVISAATSQDATLAAMDYTLRYWKSAKDAAARRIPLVERELPKGGDAGQLP